MIVIISSWCQGCRIIHRVEATQLFETPSYAFAARGARSYDVAPDGKQFVMLTNADTSGARATLPRIVVVQNWFEALKQLVPTK